MQDNGKSLFYCAYTILKAHTLSVQAKFHHTSSFDVEFNQPHWSVFITGVLISTNPHLNIVYGWQWEASVEPWSGV